MNVSRVISLFLVFVPGVVNAQLSLSEAESLARRLNPIMKAADADVMAAKSVALQMLAPFNPMLSLMAYGARRDGTIMEVGLGAEMLADSGYGANATISWNLFSNGQDATSRKLGALEVTSAETRWRTTWQDLLLEVRTEFAEGLRLQEEAEARKAALDSAAEVERQTKERYEVGSVPYASLLSATAERFKKERELARVRAELQGALARVAACCGAEVTGGRFGEWDVPFEPPADLEAALAEAKENSPQLKSIAQEIRHWELKARIVSQSGGPSLSLFASADQISKSHEMRNDGTQFGAVMSWPIFDGGLRRAEVSEANKRVKQKRAEWESAWNWAQAELTAEWAQWKEAPILINAAKAEIEAAEEAYRVTVARYDENRATHAEVIGARAQWVEAIAGLAEANAYKRVAWSRMVRHLGRPGSAEGG